MVLEGKTSSPSSTAVGMVTEAREEQPLKALLPIDVTDEGMVTEAREKHPWKAYSPIDVTDEGMVTEAREEQ